MLKIPALEGFSSPKIISLKKMKEKIISVRQQGKSVGLCHGGFDFMHPGHIKHFESAKQLCDVLIVSVTSDRFVAGRKGSGRPVFTDSLRAYSIAALECVDYVIVTDFEKAVPLLEILKPSYYIKGPDFIGKSTPGITAEREAIVRVGGEMKYTADVKLSTTEIISYVQTHVERKRLLLALDRDGTLIQNVNFLGRNEGWREELKLNEEVLDFVSYLQRAYITTSMVVSNQAGVARGYFGYERVEEINTHLQAKFNARGISIHNWQYAKEVDAAYAQKKNDELTFVPEWVKEKTKRKPRPDMVFDALQELGKSIRDFDCILVLGDREEDKGLAENLKASFIDVKGKKCEELKKEFVW